MAYSCDMQSRSAACSLQRSSGDHAPAPIRADDIIGPTVTAFQSPTIRSPASLLDSLSTSPLTLDSSFVCAFYLQPTPAHDYLCLASAPLSCLLSKHNVFVDCYSHPFSEEEDGGFLLLRSGCNTELKLDSQLSLDAELVRWLWIAGFELHGCVSTGFV
jgi:hypothetical protein